MWKAGGVAAVLVLTACSSSGSSGPPNAEPTGEGASTIGSTSPPTMPGTASAPSIAIAPTSSAIAPVDCAAQPTWRPLGEPGTGGWGTAVAISPDDPQTVLSGGDVFGIARTDDGGATWSPGRGLSGYEIERFTWSLPGTGIVWAATLGGPELSTDGGQNWTGVRQGFPELSATSYSAPVSAILTDPADSQRALAFVGSARLTEDTGSTVLDPSRFGTVWETADLGATWNQIGVVAEGTAVTDAVRLADGTLLAALDEAGVARSADGGRTWQPSGTGLDGANVRDLDASTDGSLVVAAVGSTSSDGAVEPGGVFRSTDGGTTFAEADGGLPPSSGAADPTLVRNFRAVRIAPSDASIVYATDNAYGVQAIYRSSDGAESWTELLSAGTVQPQRFYSTLVTAHAIDVDPANPKHAVVAANEFVMSTADGGRSWADLGSTPVQGADTYQGRGISGLVTTSIVFGAGDRVVVTSLDGGNLLESTDGGVTWRRPIEELEPFGGSMGGASSPTGTVVVLLGQPSGRSFDGIARSTEPGVWTILSGAGVGLPEPGADTVAMWVTHGPGGFLAVIGDAVFRSVDDGATWSRIEGAPAASKVASLPVEGAPIWLTDDAAMYVSADGTTFTQVPAGPVSIRSLSADPGDPTTVYATSGPGDTPGVWRYSAAAGWTNLFAESTAMQVAVDPTNPSRLLLVTNDDPYHDKMQSTGVWCSIDRGATWTSISETLPITRFRSATFDPVRAGHVIVGSNGMGFFRTELGG